MINLRQSPKSKAKIAKRPDKALTSEEIRQHPDEVKAAIKA